MYAVFPPGVFQCWKVAPSSLPPPPRCARCTFFFPRSASVLRATSPRSPAGRQPSGAQPPSGRVGPLCTTLHYVWCTTMQPRMVERGFRTGALLPTGRCSPAHARRALPGGLALPFSVRLPRQEVARRARTPLPQHVGSAAAQTAGKPRLREQAALALQTALCLLTRARRRGSADGDGRSAWQHAARYIHARLHCIAPLAGRPTRIRRT